MATSTNHVSCVQHPQLRPDLSAHKCHSIPVAQTIQEALHGKCPGHWYDAMARQMQHMIGFNTWTLAELPPGRKSIACKWVFDVEPSLNGDDCVKKFEARRVVAVCRNEHESITMKHLHRRHITNRAGSFSRLQPNIHCRFDK